MFEASDLVQKQFDQLDIIQQHVNEQPFAF